ncbi:MAG: hypothetical protein A2846_01175 [Candidatus Doudnabacteria bacterium RIFCSPHIGHO2_01_FULL_49_9]|uniref:Uncharacterized protein n=1 Tax=Candidatus Doudnabacteria bacterium RIFCSPHIGHO2_01_FULL_49_9 TaxID=1817827 RepID=A0A1F5P434_9BACT|nr:MAG: hypothetical protein A2846_01175 [Candidatus Doudnabacteria bacterium RIFCSPHIGHO2_01_FULL_49_9]
MSPDKWEEIKENIQKQFTVEEQGKEDLQAETGEGMVKIGEAEFVVFASPLGRLKLQFGTKAKLDDKKYHYSHRAGQGARVEYKFSDTETVHTFHAFKWDDQNDEWKEIDAEKFSL